MKGGVHSLGGTIRQMPADSAIVRILFKRKKEEGRREGGKKRRRGEREKGREGGLDTTPELSLIIPCTVIHKITRMLER